MDLINGLNLINKALKNRVAFQKQQHSRFKQADEFSSLLADDGQDLAIIASDNYFTQRAKNRQREH